MIVKGCDSIFAFTRSTRTDQELEATVRCKNNYDQDSVGMHLVAKAEKTGRV